MEPLVVPNKTIYVADADLPLFERAQELAGGNLSAAIAQALRAFVEQEGSQDPGEVIVKVGSGGAYAQKRFHGQLIGRQSVTAPDRAHVLQYRVYLTAKGQFAVSIREEPDWTHWGRYWAHRGRHRDPREGDPWDQGGDWWNPVCRLEVYSTLDELRDNIPPELFAVVQSVKGGIEDLDI
jgi:EXLDI family protein